jgi:hypothetical protein
MTAQATFSQKARRKAASFLLLPFALLIAPLLAAGTFVAYVLWPTWPSAPVALDAPPLPVTVAGVLFEVPPAAIRAAVQRHPGPHERVDLAFLWPSLQPPLPTAKIGSGPLDSIDRSNAEAPTPKTEAADADGRLFVTINALGALLPPAERLHSIYPRYVESQARAGADDLAILPFRAGTPYDGEDLIYVADSPERFYARCTRQSAVVPGTCIQERVLGGADITLRFPRDWLRSWQSVAAGFDRLVAQLRPLEN